VILLGSIEIILNPPVVKTKGRPDNKRNKSCLEKPSKNKRKHNKISKVIPEKTENNYKLRSKVNPKLD